MKKLLLLLSLPLFFFSCQPDEDPLCEDIDCANGGDCLDGSCTCDEMWQGTFCEQQKTPLSITIESFELTDFPANNSDGNPWDADGGPDIFFSIENPNGSLYRSATRDDLTSAAEWSGLDLKISEVDFTRNLSIVLFDDDLSDSEFMVVFEVLLYENTDGFPGAVLVAENGGDYQGRLELTYNF